MDPNAALARARTLSHAIDNPGSYDVAALAGDLVEVVNGLDDWLTRGGSLPDDWAMATWSPRA